LCGGTCTCIAGK